MQNRFDKGSIAMCAMAVLLGLAAQARTFEFKQFKSTGSKANSEYYWMGTEKSKSSWYQVKIGGASKIDDMSEMEIRAATVFKNVKDRKAGVNDIAKFKFDPINKGKAIYFMVSSGVAFSLERDKYWYGNDGRADRGWQLAGCIIEIWQKGKVVKHWSGAGTAGKTRLADGIPLLRINKDGYASEGDRNRIDRDFDNATKIFSVDQKGERVDIDDVLQPYRESEEESKSDSEKKSAKKDDSASDAPAKNVVAQKLRQCDFLLNEKFKKNAKFYLCLFSASWCPPCRREMPRIAETYAETLKGDPDIELIHFSRDQDEEKAMAWAKEHDVKFPVVKPKGGNPLDLHARGIPHLFIVKADGTLVEEGHPMSIFNEEKFRELKGGSPVDSAKPNSGNGGTKTLGSCRSRVQNGAVPMRDYTWPFKIVNGEATIGIDRGGCGCKISPNPTGNLCIPSTLGGAPVTGIGWFALVDCKDITSVSIPASVTKISRRAFARCKRLTSFSVAPDNPAYSSRDGFLCSKDGATLIAGLNGDVVIPSCVTRIDDDAFFQCEGVTSVRIPTSVKSIGKSAFAQCVRLTSFSVDADNSSYSSRGGFLCSKDGSTLIAGLNGDVVIPSCVKTIGEGAFDGYALTSVKIPQSVTGIEDSAFFWCTKLASVAIPSSVTYIGNGVFSWCYELSNITVDGGNAYYCSVDGVLYNKAKTELLHFPRKKCGVVMIPSGVTSIPHDMFSGCKGVPSVTIPASVTSIGRDAFSYCRGLTSVTMLGERPDVGGKIFASCDKLAMIRVPSNVKSWAGMKEWQGIPLVFDAESTK